MVGKSLIAGAALFLASCWPAAAQQPCALVDFNTSPTTLAVGAETPWVNAFIFSPQPGQTCTLDAKVTSNPGSVEFKVAAVNHPYSCQLPALTDLRCNGQGSNTTGLTVWSFGRAAGKSTLTVTVNGVQRTFATTVVDHFVYLPVVVHP